MTPLWRRLVHLFRGSDQDVREQREVDQDIAEQRRIDALNRHLNQLEEKIKLLTLKEERRHT